MIELQVTEDAPIVLDVESSPRVRMTIAEQIINQGGAGLSDEVKQALLDCFAHVAWIDEHGQEYYDALYAALYPPTELDYITAVYTQSGTVYDTDTLDSLKSDLVVVAHYDDGTSEPVTAYTLSGTLEVGTSTITVSYGGKTTSFDVSVSAHIITGWYYPFNESLLSAGTKDFGFVGSGVYGSGRNENAKAYYHIIPTPGTASSDTQYGLKATNISDFPNFDSDFTISYWFAAQADTGYMHPFYFTIYTNDSSPAFMLSNLSTGGGWTLYQNTGTNSNKTTGIAIQGTATGQLLLRLTSGNREGSSALRLVKPNSFDPSDWHHYAITKKGSVYRFFVDGAVVFSATSAYTTVYKAGQLAIIASFEQTSANKSNLAQIPNGGKMQDFYVAEFCKWDADFDPESIVY